EALYADMSHFGRKPITFAWYSFVFPALVLNYVGQAAIIAADPKALDSPFYALTQGWLLLPMVALATAATIIASQSLIAGAFTLTEQAIALNLSPRMAVLHTSKDERGQVYVPMINAVLAIVCIALVVTFRSSDRLAAMYGLAVSATMLATDLVFYVVATRTLRWKPVVALPLALAFGALDATFVTAGLPKFLAGAWVPVVIAAAICLVAVTWLTGRRAVAHELRNQLEPVEQFAKEHAASPRRQDATIVLLTGYPEGVPLVNSHPWLHRLVHDRMVVLLTVDFPARPYLDEAERVKVDHLASGFVRVCAYFGYMETPRIAPILRACEARELELDDDATAFVYADPVVVSKSRGGLPRWQRHLFDVMQRLSRTLATDLEIKPDRRLEVGIEVAV
ncbi:MAG: KUP/HAK/KT family potassium transporter, partial [Candidatus Eremiobacteraeota bacterium]|nr:KUP/HAK/KT family potassium transporter [Candidatus Eremiobacteraeota bacterium]